MTMAASLSVQVKSSEGSGSRNSSVTVMLTGEAPGLRAAMPPINTPSHTDFSLMRDLPWSARSPVVRCYEAGAEKVICVFSPLPDSSLGTSQVRGARCMMSSGCAVRRLIPAI